MLKLKFFVLSSLFGWFLLTLVEQQEISGWFLAYGCFFFYFLPLVLIYDTLYIAYNEPSFSKARNFIERYGGFMVKKEALALYYLALLLLSCSEFVVNAVLDAGHAYYNFITSLLLTSSALV